MAEPFIGEIRPFPYNFAPRGWAFCEGQLLPISQNTALFSLLGTTFGGDGRTTFALPDLRGRVPVGAGTGPGLSARVLGEEAGEDGVTLGTAELPPHTHTPVASADPADRYSPVGARPAVTDRKIYGAATSGQLMDAGAISEVGGNQAHENRRPLLALSMCIALVGIYPPRS
jgi:microcystin-dependent protein